MYSGRAVLFPISFFNRLNKPSFSLLSTAWTFCSFLQLFSTVYLLILDVPDDQNQAQDCRWGIAGPRMVPFQFTAGRLQGAVAAAAPCCACLSHVSRAVFYFLTCQVMRCVLITQVLLLTGTVNSFSRPVAFPAHKVRSVLFTAYDTAHCDFQHISAIKNHFIVMFLACYRLLAK